MSDEAGTAGGGPRVFWCGTVSDFLSTTGSDRDTLRAAVGSATGSMGRGDSTLDEAEAQAEMDARGAVSKLPLLAEDRKFIDHQTRFLRRDLRIAGLRMYLRVFRRGMNACESPIQKENAGRRRANAFLRRWVARTVTLRSNL